MENESMKLHGMFASPFVRRVKIALKMKGIPFDYFEEDLKNKSSLLLLYNPVMKLVPVLVHNGRPIAESLIIVEYIDQMSKNSPHLFPLDPYHRAIVRFRADFINLQIIEKLRDVCTAPNDDEQEKVMKAIQENMSKLEANVKDLWSGSSSSDGKSMDILDILMTTLLPIVKGIEEAINIDFIDAESYPLAFAWMRSHDGVPAVEETVPNKQNLVKFLQKLRQHFRRQARM